MPRRPAITPDLPGAGLLGTVRKEVERNAVRARNGVKWAVGAEWAPPHPTPSDVIWRDAAGKAHVRHYRRDTPPRFEQPVIAFLGLVGRSYVFDLYKGGSIVEMLMDWGFDVYVMDWGVADEQDAGNTIETYLKGYWPRGIDAVCEEGGADRVNLFAYCMGGCMAVHGLAAQPELPVHSLVTLASPWDFRHLGAMVDALRAGRVPPDQVLDHTGNVPGSTVRESFKSRKPTGDIVNYVNLWQNLWNDQYVEGYQAIGRFLHDHIPLPGAVYHQLTQQWMRDNGFVNDTLRFDGRRISLTTIRIPVLGVVAKKDDICSEEAARPIVDILPNAQVELLEIDAGHVSLFSGRRSVKVVMPQIFEWIERQSTEVG
jgi:polyhydroxyalkanoate synthase